MEPGVGGEVLLEVSDLRTHFFTDEGVVRAVDGVSFTVIRGRTLGVLGESGCGKSVTGFSLLNLVRPPGKIVGGSVLLYQDGGRRVDLAKLGPRSEALRRVRGRDVSMIFQEPLSALDPLYTVGAQVAEAIRVHERVDKAGARARAVQLFRQVGLPGPETAVDRYPHQLSGGQRQRAVIALALACGPKLLIADEPTTALDVTTEAQILKLLRELQRTLGMAMIFITHDLGVIAEVADEVVVMYLGRVVERAGVADIFERPKHPYTQALLASVPKLGGERKPRLTAISGGVPSPRDLPTGCTFGPRCPQFMPGRCDRLEPALLPVEPGHEVRCLLYEGGGA